MKGEVIITGGAGFIGSHLVDRLLQDGQWKITVVDNFHPNYPRSIKTSNPARHIGNPDYSFVEGDILDDRTLDRIFSEVTGTNATVVHLAALVGVRPSLKNPKAYHRVNVTGTLKLLEKARKARIAHFMLASSSSVYGELQDVPWKETAGDLKPISPYAATKMAAEELVRVYARLHGMNSTVLRFFTVYGPRQRPDLAIHSFFRKIAQGLPVQQFGDGSTQRDYTFVDDIVSGVHKAIGRRMEAAEGQGAFDIFNLGNSSTVALRDLIHAIEREVGRKAVLQVLPEQPGDVPRTFANVEKAKAAFGYVPHTGIAEGLVEFHRWYKETALETLDT